MMVLNFKTFIFLLLASLLVSCNNDDDTDPKNTTDLSVTMTTSSDIPNVSTTLTFTLTVTNDGPLDANDVKVINKIVSGYTFPLVLVCNECLLIKRPRIKRLQRGIFR